jgi:hypothetical protein
LLRQSVTAITSGEKLGDFFQYVIEKPVSLPRQKSALLPSVGKGVEASRVSIYNEGAQAKFPLLGLRLKNTSGLHLLQGPVAVFEGGTYAGDARIADLQPDEERLLSYAVDLGTEVKPEAADGGRLTQVKVVQGVLYTTTKLRETKTYTVKNRNPPPPVRKPTPESAPPGGPRGRTVFLYFRCEVVPAPRPAALARRALGNPLSRRYAPRLICAKEVARFTNRRGPAAPPGRATPGVPPAAGPGEGAGAHVARELACQDGPGRPPPAWKATPARGADWRGVFEHGLGGGHAGPD